MLPDDIIKLVLSFHEPKCVSFHMHSGFSCMVCWCYNPYLKVLGDIQLKYE